MESITIGGKRYKVGGKVKGAYDNKYNRAAKLAARFDVLNTKMAEMLERCGMSIQGQCALSVLMLLHSGIRVGNEDSAEGYMTNPHPNAKDQTPKFVQTYGLTTLLKEHVLLDGITTYLNFVGKKSVENEFEILNHRITFGLRQLMNEGHGTRVFNISDYELNKFIKSEIGEQFSAKDFRCMRANLYASEFIDTEMTSYNKKGEFKRDLKRLYEHVAAKLNNTPGVCKRSYVWDGLPSYLECLIN
jgi:DNA topoisomerase I